MNKMNLNKGIKPQDVGILLLMLAYPQKEWRQVDIAMALGISQSEVSHGLERAVFSRLLSSDKKTVFKPILYEFVVHGLPRVFPARPAYSTRGVPTSHSFAPLSQEILSGGQEYVWPDPDGEVMGAAIEPLFPGAPKAALNYPRLHELMALVDSQRVGRAREVNLGRKFLEERIYA
ncbi:MAG: hypothetical protein H6581_22420 [Bacteroidia bacterium]|nr:hypothetical protein [Bacteroidia bacterium]